MLSLDKEGGYIMKISIVGVGRVGSTLAFALISKGFAEELVLVSRSRATAEAEAQDLMHASAFTTERVTIRAGEVSDTAGSHIIALCVSVPHREEMRTRNDFAVENARLLAEIVPPLAAASPQSVLLVVTNPVDAMTYATWQYSGFPWQRVIGTGTLIDSARFRAFLSEEIGIHPDDIRAYILGEHGDTQFPALSMSMTGGVPFEQNELAERLFQKTLRIGYDIMRTKGYTNYAIALAASLIIESIVHDARRTIPVSTLINGYCGVRDVCLSVPAVVGRAGVVRHLEPRLSSSEVAAFRHSAETVRATIEAAQNASRSAPS